MSPVIKNSDVIYIEKEASYERGDIVIFDGISENENWALEIQLAEQLLIKRANELGLAEGENNTPELPSKFPDENYIQKEKLKCFSQINIGRIVGFPTEKIVIRYGEIFINGTELSEPYVTNGFPENYTLDYVIPVGSYFILPDSRPGICESTEVGGIPKVQILGKVTEIYSPGSGSLFEQRASGWLLITLLFLSPILISRRIIAPKTVRVFTAQYNMLSFLVFALIVVSAFAQKYFPSISLININWFFPANYFYLIVSWVKYVTQTSTYSALANIVIVFASVVISTIEIKEYIDKLSKSSRSKELSD